MNGHTKMKTRIGTVEKAQNLLREWWGRGMRSRQRTTDWVTHTFREHNKEADLWAGKGAQGRAEECVDTTRSTWREVTGVCGFGDGSFDNGSCGERHLSSWPSRNLTDGFLSTKSVALCQGTAPWMLKMGGGGCLLTIYNSGWKSAPAESVQLFDQLRIEI